MRSNRDRLDSQQRSQRMLRRGLTFFVATCLTATVGYVLAGWEWIDAIYMVTITIFGVGYGEVKPIDDVWLKIFTIAVIFSGCSSLIYVVGGIVQMLAEGEIERMLGVRSRWREADQLSDHTIICGYGRVGKMLAVELSNHGESVVILDNDPNCVEKANNDGFLAVEGDAAEDDTLSRVGLLRARALAAVLSDDAVNVFITLTARDLSDNIRIIARAEMPSTERKLYRGGANSVVLLSAIGAVRIAQLVCSSDGPDAAALPEQRYRMLNAVARRDAAGNNAEMAEAVEREVAELATLAGDLSRSLSERQLDQKKVEATG